MIRIDQHEQVVFSLTLTSDVFGEVNLEYWPGRFGAYVQKVGVSEGIAALPLMLDAIEQSIKWWDVYEAEGCPLPVSNARSMPISLAVWIFSGICHDWSERCRFTSEVKE